MKFQVMLYFTEIPSEMDDDWVPQVRKPPRVSSPKFTSNKDIGHICDGGFPKILRDSAVNPIA